MTETSETTAQTIKKRFANFLRWFSDSVMPQRYKTYSTVNVKERRMAAQSHGHLTCLTVETLLLTFLAQIGNSSPHET